MRVISGAGGGGEEQSQHTPVEAPNTLRSRATWNLVYLISEGPVEAVLAEGLKSLFFDNTPLQNADGSFNFSNVVVEYRNGYPTQDALTGFVDVEVEVGVGVEVKHATPIVRSITDPDATAARVTIQTAQFLKADTGTGDVNPVSVTLAIEVQPDGGTFGVVRWETIAGKTDSDYQVSYRVELPAGGAPWSIRVSRQTQDSDSVSLSDAINWASYTIVKDYRLNYPNSAVLGIKVDAEATGGKLPQLSFESKGLIVSVPTNYDPVTRAYAGIWDGTFKQAYTDNNAWIWYALVTNDRWGMGRFGYTALADKFVVYAIGQYCDGLVPDGQGGFEPRYTFNGSIDSSEDAIRVLQTIASSFRAAAFWAGSDLRLACDMPTDPAGTPIVPGNVASGQVTYEGASRKARSTVCLVTWFNPEIGYSRDIEPVEDRDLIARYGRRVKEVVAVGCTSRSLAHRLGRWTLESDHEGDIAHWAGGWDHCDFAPGDVRQVFDRHHSGKDWGGRIAGVTLDDDDKAIAITLDRSVTIEEGLIYSIYVALPDGSQDNRVLNNVAGDATVVTFDAPMAQAPLRGAIWGLASEVLVPRLFRIRAVEESEGYQYAVTAVEHDPTKFARIEENLIIAAPPTSGFQRGAIVAPTNIGAIESITLVGGNQPHSKVTISWTASTDSRVSHYQVQVKVPDGEWAPLKPDSFTSGVSIDMLDLVDGIHGFRVRAFDHLGRFSAWNTTESVDLDGLLLEPVDITQLVPAYISGRVHLQWQEVIDYRGVLYEIRKGNDFATAQEIAVVRHSPWGTLGNGTYWVAAFIGPTEGTRIYSLNWASVEITNSVLVENVVVTHDEKDEGWPGQFFGTAAISGDNIVTSGVSNMLDIADFLGVPNVLSAGNQASGFYRSTIIVDLGRIMAFRTSVDWQGTGIPQDDNILTQTDILANPDIISGGRAPLVNVYPVFRLADDTATDVFAEPDVFDPADIFGAGQNWTDFKRWTPDVQYARYVNFGLILETNDPQTIAVGLDFKWTVDVVDRVDKYSGLVIPDTGYALTFRPINASEDSPFLGGPGASPLPIVLPFLVEPNGKFIEVTSITLTGCTLRVRDSAGVAVSATGGGAIVQGY